MQVELAWLADPILFPYLLSTQVQDETLTVRGFVPTEAVRNRALRVARAKTTLQVRDQIRVHPTLTAHSSDVSQEVVQRAARDLLAESFGDRARAVTVIIGRDGQITLLGMIASEADSLNVTRKLRQVPGCRYVVNQLMVSADPEFSPGPATIPAAPGSLPPANAGSSKGPGGLLPVAAAKPLAPPSKPTTPVVPVGHTGSSSPPSSPPAPRQDFSKLQGTQGVSSQLPEVSFRASTWGEQPLPAARSGGSTGSMVKDPANTPGPPLPLLPAKPAKIPSTASHPVEGSFRASTWSAEPSRLPQFQATPLPQLSLTPQVRTTPLNPAVMPAGSYTVSGVVTIPSEDPPATKPEGLIQRVGWLFGRSTSTPPATSGTAPQPGQAGPLPVTAPSSMGLKTTTGRLVVLTPAQLKRRIETTCGRSVRQVLVASQGPRNLQVRLTVRSEDEGQILSRKVLEMPELAAYEVNLSVEVKP